MYYISTIRVDIKRTMYTGALCGLGHIEGEEEPLFGDYDIALTFDYKIRNDEIEQV